MSSSQRLRCLGACKLWLFFTSVTLANHSVLIISQPNAKVDLLFAALAPWGDSCTFCQRPLPHRTTCALTWVIQDAGIFSAFPRWSPGDCPTGKSSGSSEWWQESVPGPRLWGHFLEMQRNNMASVRMNVAFSNSTWPWACSVVYLCHNFLHVCPKMSMNCA